MKFKREDFIKYFTFYSLGSGVATGLGDEYPKA